jgi:hypothetical protein
MTITISGTTGIAGVDGSAGTPAVQGTDTNTGIFFPAADTIAFAEGGTEVMRLDSSANLQFNSGYGSVATAYGCRAWVNFDGTTNTNLSGTYSQSGTTVTVTATSHGLIVGNVVYSDITSGTGVDGTYTVATVTDANTFTYTAGTSLTTSGNITIRRNTIRASGNVSSITDNGTGDYTVNFATAMPDVNYVVHSAVGYGLATRPNFSSFTVSSLATGSVGITTGIMASSANNGLLADYSEVCVAIFR